VKRKECVSCKSKNLHPIIDLGVHPFADSFFSEIDKYRGITLYPLGVVLCSDCKLIQTSCVTDADKRYKAVDYAYNSENSSIAREHWSAFAENHVNWLASKRDKILEVGSNDGYLLSKFSALGYPCLGIDPADSQTQIARSRGLEIIQDIFTSKLAETLPGSYKLVIGNNVFNHSDDPLDFLAGVRSILEPEGRFVFEVPYWGNLVSDNRFEQIYHEHVTYFTVTNVKILAEVSGFKIVNVSLVNYHGGSLRIELMRSDSFVEPPDQMIRHWLETEQKHSFHEAKRYQSLQKQIDDLKKSLLAEITKFRASGFIVGALGAAAKGNTILNWLGVTANDFEFVLDSSPHKIGKYTPGSNIPICNDEKVRGIPKVALLVLAWNISNTVKQKLGQINPDIKYIGDIDEINKD
jgi:SAM-dependent methyltransferase